MSLNSKIEWTEATWNPVRGCTKISPGCKHCYAETFAERFRGVPGHPYEQGFDPLLVPHKLSEPAAWSHPRTVFVNSMSDLFQDAVPTEYIASVINVMSKVRWHTYQVLTKRAGRMRDLLSSDLNQYSVEPHIWWGVSVEDRKYGLPRLDLLRRTPGVVRFLSIEPLLEDLGSIDLSGIHWVIVGGESGPGARKMESAWVERIQSQCEEQGVPFFFKQWGGVQKKRTGRLLRGTTYDGFPDRETSEVPTAAVRASIRLELERIAARWAGSTGHSRSAAADDPNVAV